MGRKAGVSADDTRRGLLAAAARVFSLKGYDGASIADITAEAGLSSGAIYAHYGSKAELFVAVVRAHGRRQFADLVGLEQQDDRIVLPDDVRDIADFFTLVGSTYDGRQPVDADLLVEAIVASKRHPEVAELVGSWTTDGEATLTQVVRGSQARGALDPELGAEAIARFVTMVGLGARLSTALGLGPIDHDEWTAVIERLVDAIRHPQEDPQ